MSKKRSATGGIHSPRYKENRTDSDAGSSDLAVGTATGKDLIVSVRKAKTDRNKREIVVLSLTHSNIRPDSILGSKQGDHVTAYKSFLEMLTTAADGRTLRKVPHHIANVAKALMPHKSEQFDRILVDLETEMREVVSRDERHEILEALSRAGGTIDKKLVNKVEQALKDSRKHLFMTAVEQIAQSFITEINLDEDTAFKRMGEADKSEGERVKTAIYGLKAINDLLEIKRLAVSGQEIREAMNSFYSDYLKIGAPYKMIKNSPFGSSAVKDLEISWKGKTDDKKKEALSTLYNRLNFTTKVSGFFGDLFDFNRVRHIEEDIEETLYKVVAKHLVAMFNAFNELNSFDDATKTAIIDSFLRETVLEKQGWKELKLSDDTKRRGIIMNLDTLRNGIRRYADLREFKMLPVLDSAPLITEGAGTRTYAGAGAGSGVYYRGG